MALTIQQAAEVTGWSPRMLRYLERSGLVLPMRTAGGHRTYVPRQIERLRSLKELTERFDIGPSDVVFELRLRTEPELGQALDEWFGAVHRAAAPARASLYRRLADDPAILPVLAAKGVSMTASPGVTLVPDSAGSVTDFKVADLSLAAFGRKEITLAEHEMP